MNKINVDNVLASLYLDFFYKTADFIKVIHYPTDIILMSNQMNLSIKQLLQKIDT